MTRALHLSRRFGGALWILPALALGWFVQAVGMPPLLTLLILAGGLLSLLPFVIAFARRSFDPFEPVYLFAFAYFVLFVIRPAFDVSGGLAPWQGFDPAPHYARALSIGVLGAMSFYVGYYARVGRRIANRLRVPSFELVDEALTGFIFVCLSLAIVVFGLFLLQKGGLGAVVGGRSVERKVALTTSSGYLYTAPLWLWSLGGLLLALTPTWRSARGVLGIVLVVVSQVTALGGGSRSWLLPAIGTVVIVWYLKEDRRPRKKTLLAALAVVFVFGITVPRELRNVTGAHRSVGEVVKQSFVHPLAPLQQFFESADTSIVTNFAVELQFVPQQIHYRYGETYIAALGDPIPRALWPSKPSALDTQIMQTIWPVKAANGTGFSFSFFSEPYVNFGYAGVIAITFLFGLAWQVLYRWYRRAPRHPFAIALFGISWSFMIIYMRGGLGVSYSRQVMALAPALFVVALARRRQGRRAIEMPLGGSVARL